LFDARPEWGRAGAADRLHGLDNHGHQRIVDPQVTRRASR
jgi:hypothetical protein